MALIYESLNFTVESADKPHIDRNDGGHVRIVPKVRVVDRQHLAPYLAIELMRLTIVAGAAMVIAMKKQGVDIGRINYQDNGNWSVFKPNGSYLHIHLYGRAINASVQKYGQALFMPHIEEQPEYYEKFKPLSKDDVIAVRTEIQRLFKEDKYSDTIWGLNFEKEY